MNYFEIENCHIYNTDCLKWMEAISKSDAKMNIVLTSPPYNTGRPCFGEDKLKNHEGRYDIFFDNKTNDEYSDWTVELFSKFDAILSKNGVVLYNMSYSSENTECMFLTVADVIRKSNFTVADHIVWKKSTALPNNTSPNKLTRIFESVFVFCRKSEFKTFTCNKNVTSVRATGQKMYQNIFNFIEARNNDESCKLNKATFSTEFVTKLLEIYAKTDDIVYDPFSGTGTTAKACLLKGLEFHGTELSENQFEYTKERLQRAFSSVGRAVDS